LRVDADRRNRVGGSFMLIDEATEQTASAGMVLNRHAQPDWVPAASRRGPDAETAPQVTIG
jgi:sulfate adenylyltransferase subunit 1 (EFTu-like GTPase family)